METSYSPPGGKPILAPDGVAFLKEPVSFQHATGVQGIIQGTAVNIVEKKPDGTLWVAHKDRKFSVKPYQVTYDMGEAEWLFQLEQAKQRQLARAQVDLRNLQAIHEQERQAVFARALSEAASRRSTASVSSSSSSGVAPGAQFESRLKRGPYNPSRGSPVHIGHESDGRRFWVDGGGTKHYIYDSQPHSFVPVEESSSEGASESYDDAEAPQAKMRSLLQKLLNGEME